MAYSSSESGFLQVYVRPFPARPDGGKYQISTNVGRFPVWSRTAKELFYTDVNGRIMVVTYSVNGNTFVPGPPRLWSQAALLLTGNAPPLDLAPDGKRMLASLPPDNSTGAEKDSLHVTFLLNFFDELKRRMP
jgi:hypothetical protein